MLARALKLFTLIFLTPLALHGVWWIANDPDVGWSRADWTSTGLLPAPRAKPEAMVHVYSGRVGRWRGVFAEHTWIVVKERGAARYTRFDKTFWGNPVKTDAWAADARWYGHAPTLIGRVEGLEAERLIPKIRRAVAEYPHRRPGGYRLYPGPNSNSFVAHVLRQVAETGIALPPTAIGKDFRSDGTFVGLTPSGTGYEISVFGLLAAAIGRAEGVEISILGLTAGIDVFRPALKLPGVGRIGLATD
jgi:hypothetical protein